MAIPHRVVLYWTVAFCLGGFLVDSITSAVALRSAADPPEYVLLPERPRVQQKFQFGEINEHAIMNAAVECNLHKCLDDRETVAKFIDAGQKGIFGLRFVLRVYLADREGDLIPEKKAAIEALLGYLDKAQWPLGHLRYIVDNEKKPVENDKK